MTKILSTAFLLVVSVTAGAAGTPPPNLLIIQTDEHNFRTLGCYRQTLADQQAFVWGKDAVVETPAIDSIAQRGAICTSYYATSPVCTPSRAAFFSGRYPQNTGSWQNDRPLSGDIVTFAEVLRRQGYSTGYAGKWHLDGAGKPQWQPKRKFGFTDNRFMFNRGHWKKFELTADGPRVAARSKQGDPSYSLAGADQESFSTDWLSNRAMDFIRKHAGEPFCYHLSLPDPHGPNAVRAPYDQMFENTPIRPPATFQTEYPLPKYIGSGAKNAKLSFRADQMSLYFGMVRCIDDNVGRILALIDELNLTDRTIVVFTSDHGDLCYEHGRLNKGNPYEGSAKIPMIIAAPGKIPAGKRIDQALGTVDFAPTILSLMEMDSPDGIEGRDASALLVGNADQPSWDDVTFLRSAGSKPGWLAAVSDQYKLVVSVADVPWLFDLKSDPDELINHAGDPEHAADLQRLAQAMVAYAQASTDPHMESSEISSALKSLVQ
ncbi:Choline-sulfatase [Rubripirellula lacrimiformis]|uniref:Choline-sulfatase n=1 Tax=Rubripirellula lacrimiformis TaxID=1930273 RepID=A0A517NIY9_9BACT|nr:sulfatase [Rubripirellula lacrimiformis]QDT07097.1 Choline-sulfatase [Rubripirellula lacrimiformis]